MKALSFLFISFLSFAQTQLPDSIFLVDGRSTACLVTQVENDKIHFIYNNGMEEFIILKALNRVCMQNYGNVFLQNTGFTKDVNELNMFSEARLEKFNTEKETRAELNRINLEHNESQTPIIEPEIEMTGSTNISQFKPKTNFNKWSFGVLYIPYYSGNIFRIVYTGSSYDPYQVYANAVNQTNLEAQLSYAILPQLRITFDAGYSASVQEVNSESHYRSVNDPYYNYDRGNENIRGLKLLDFNIGAKYYFQNFISNKVSVYAIFGFGKQFAFSEIKDKDLYITPNPDDISEDNSEEFNEEINSPWHFNFGFGAEYFFNESLSLTSNIKVLYSTHTGTFESRNVNLSYSQTYKQEYSLKEFVTRIGLGFNFYF